MSQQDWQHRKEQDLWSEDDKFPRAVWIREVSFGDVQSGYWDWVAEQYFQQDSAVEGAKLLSHDGLLEAAKNGAELGTCDED